MNVKAIILIVAILGFIGVVLFLPGSDQGGTGTVRLVVGAPVPNVQLTDLDGRSWDLAELRGSVVIVNFWATWCPPCKEEMPSLQRLYGKYEARDDFEVLAILYRDLPDAARTFVTQNGFAFPILPDNDRTARAYGVTGVPETYIIDRNGILRQMFKGPVQFDSQDSYAFIDKLLAEPGE